MATIQDTLNEKRFKLQLAETAIDEMAMAGWNESNSTLYRQLVRDAETLPWQIFELELEAESLQHSPVAIINKPLFDGIDL